MDNYKRDVILRIEASELAYLEISKRRKGGFCALVDCKWSGWVHQYDKYSKIEEILHDQEKEIIAKIKVKEDSDSEYNSTPHLKKLLTKLRAGKQLTL